MQTVTVTKIIEDDYVIFKSEKGFGWFEMFDFVDLDEDDILSGNFETYGPEKITKETTGEIFEVSIEDVMQSLELCIEQIEKEIEYHKNKQSMIAAQNG